MPLQQLWELLLGRPVDVRIFEDNEGTILVAKSGYSPALWHLLKTQKCSVDLVHRVIYEQQLCDLEHVSTGSQVADIFTKSLAGPQWEQALSLLRVERGQKLTASRA